MTAPLSDDAAARIAAYLDARARFGKPDQIAEAKVAGTAWARLTVTDLRALLAERDALRGRLAERTEICDAQVKLLRLEHARTAAIRAEIAIQRQAAHRAGCGSPVDDVVGAVLDAVEARLTGRPQDGHGGQERAAGGRTPVERDTETAEAPTGPQGGAEGVPPLKFPVHCGRLGDVEDCRRPGEPFTVALDPGDPAIDCPRCRLRLASDVLKPQEWCDRYGLTILDPDGWRQAVAPDWNERIALSVFYVLLGASTSNVLATGAHDRITADLALVYAEAPDDIAPEDDATVSAEHVCHACGGDGRSVFANTEDEDDQCRTCGGTGLTLPPIAPEDEGIATADVAAQIAADEQIHQAPGSFADYLPESATSPDHGLPLEGGE